MLRRARWLLLLAILGIVAGVASLYRAQESAMRRQRPATPASLPANTASVAEDWEYEIRDGDEVKVRVRAKTFRQIKEPSAFLLGDMQMEIRDVARGRYDLIQSRAASFDVAEGRMYSEGTVEITKNLPLYPSSPPGRVLKIRSSGVSFDNATQRVWTERPATFEFDRGGGESVGATYDPGTMELRLHSQARIQWQGEGKRPPTRVEGSQIVWREETSLVLVSAPARLLRGTFELESGGDAVVFLREGGIERLEAQQARGADRPEGRELEWAAGSLHVHFAGNGEVRSIAGWGDARVASKSPTGVTAAWGDRFDLDFEPGEGGSVLKTARASGKARVESRPLAAPGRPPQPVRTLASEVIALTMRAGGKEIAEAETQAPGEIVFLPARPGDRRRQVNGERMYLYYGADNVLERFRAVVVATRTESAAEGGKTAVSTTKSRDLEAFFDAKTGQMTQMSQWNDFEYEEGPRRARAARAVFDNARAVITLTESARVWDASGSTAGDEIALNQANGEMEAQGGVTSTWLSADQPAAGGGMMSGPEPLQARARRMTTAQRNTLIRYEGGAVLWQGPSRLAAERVLIDRAGGRLRAEGGVTSLIPDERGGTGARKKTAASSTVRAPSLDYDDKRKLAHYMGGARLERPGMTVTSRSMRIWLREEKQPGGAVETKMDRMFADGAVELRQEAPDRTRTGMGEHAEYYLDDERVVLTGGNPVLTDSQRGTSRGDLIRWYARSDKLVVDNTGSGPSVSRIKRDGGR
jgi:lipopolysaccharide export system protein LptA